MILILAAILWFIVFGIALMRRTFSDAWRDVLAIGILGIATAGFFWRLLAGQVWMPAGGGDLAQFLYPTYQFSAMWWRQGVMPLWNPHLFGGMPFVGDIQSGIFYPLNLLTFFISAPLTFRDMEWLSVLHHFIAGAGMYAFLRWGKLGIANNELRISILASLAGALAFEFSDLFITHFGNLNILMTIAWLPLILLFYCRAQTDGRPGLAVVAGILLGIAFLAGHIQMFLFILIALGLLAIGMMLANRIHRTDSVHYIGGLVIIAIVSFGIAAPALLPSIEMAQNSVRASITYEQAAQFSLPPAELIGLLVPGFFGRGPQNAWGPWSRVEVGYIGVLPLVLAFLAIVLRRDAMTRFMGAFALSGLIFALGGYAIVHGWLYQFVPGFGQLRAPARFIVLMDFALAVLAAFGFDALVHSLPRDGEMIFKRVVRAAPWIFFIVALPAGVLAYSNLILGQGQDPVLFQRIANATNALAFFILLFGLSIGLLIARGTRFFRSTMWAILALVLIFFDLFSLGAYVDVSTDDPTRVYDHPDAVDFFRSIGGIYRIDSQGTGVDNLWTPDTAMLYGLQDVNGDNPLVLADFDRFWNALPSRSARAYDLLNTRFLIVRKNVPVDRDKFKLAFDDVAFNVYENTHVAPRAFIAYDARVVTSHSAALEAIRANEFDPAQTIILETAVGGQSSAVSRQPSAVEILGYGPNEILLNANADGDGILVLSEMFYPGWRAWVDEHEVKILRANYLFRAVELPAGAHRVRFVYDPPLFKLGVGIFAATVIGLVGGWILKRKKS
jgi:hypothetical protein